MLIPIRCWWYHPSPRQYRHKNSNSSQNVRMYNDETPIEPSFLKPRTHNRICNRMEFRKHYGGDPNLFFLQRRQRTERITHVISWKLKRSSPKSERWVKIHLRTYNGLRSRTATILIMLGDGKLCEVFVFDYFPLSGSCKDFSNSNRIFRQHWRKSLAKQ